MPGPDLSRRSFIQGAGGLVLASTMPPAKTVKFKKTVLDKRFVAEGVAVGDVNRDGKLDILAGNIWYEAPNWTPHEIAPFQFVDPQTAYSNCFNSWTADLNHDGWVDQIVIAYPGEKAVWRENPKGKDQPWAEHPIWRSACDESPLYVDLLGDGKKVLIMGYDDDYLAWFEPSKDPYAEWQCHNVSGKKGAGSQRYCHGLGVGDINRDGRNEILTTQGYYVSPPDPRSGPWTFVKADLGPDCAHMIVIDVNHDRLPDVVTSAAHERGVWWHEQLKDGGFARHQVDNTLSQTHSLVMAKLGGKTNFITGKRKWAHGTHGDPGPDEPALLVRYELSGSEWTKYEIDNESGVGTQFEVRDVNGDGLLDIVISNKNGVFLFEQLR